MSATWLHGARVHDLHPGIGNGPFAGGRPDGVILHVNVDEHGTPDSFWGDGNPGQVCPNFQVFKDGEVHQMLPFNWQPWCQIDGNFRYAAIETAGLPSEPLTAAQIESAARIMAVYHQDYGVPLELANAPGEHGLGTHQMGGGAWGGHACPGPIRAQQRGAILARARQLVAPAHTKPTPPAPAPTPNPTDVARYRLYTSMDKRGPVYASAPGRWVKVDAATVQALILHGETDRKIHAVHDKTLQRLRAVAIGRNS